MKAIQLCILVCCVIFLITCKTTKKSSSAAADSATNTAAATGTSSSTGSGGLMLKANPTDGIYEPGESEVLAIQPYDKDISLDKLQKGYSLYSQSACIGCHAAKDIYKIDSKRWKEILDDMAKKAEISDAQKDAVYKYVVAVKAVKLNSAK